MSEIIACQEVIEILQPGKKVRLFYGKDNPNNQIRHIRAIVDKEYIAYRVWSPKKGWMYRIAWIYHFQTAYNSGTLKPVN